MEIEREEVRNNGFAIGDRVAIVSGEWKGCIGKVTYSSIGCEWDKQCRKHCRLVAVELSYFPKDMSESQRKYYPTVAELSSIFGNYQGIKFRIDEVTHID